MPKNTKGGKKHKQLKNDSSKDDVSRIVLKDDSSYQYYAIVEKYYGHNADVKFIKNVIKGTDKVYINHQSTKENTEDIIDTEQVLHSCKAIIRGAIAKKCRLKIGDILLVSIRDYDSKKVDVLYKYSDDEVKYLLSNNILDDDFITLINSFESSVNNSSNVDYKNTRREDDIIFVNMETNDLVANFEDEKTDYINYDNI